ncbi:MAG: LacI family transcriptional regulator [Verrucomicrobia bacterium Tous-C9LFEB]|nr:MAG: LacI family transcriptional regulator [Verrucomicrobia bacterium Tous-C9LFEB]
MPPASNRRVTLRAIAQKAELSLAATSMALRNHPRISTKVREQVQSLARKMGYHPDPKLATLMHHLRAQGDVNYRETLAYVSSYDSYERWKAFPHHDYYLGAAERALELGYRLDVVHLGEPGMTPARMSHLLSTRAIRGLLIGGFDQLDASLPLQWDRFAAVAFDYSLNTPQLHRATTDYYREMLSVLARLEREGCQRIGLNANSIDDAKVLGLWYSAFLRYQHGLPRVRRIPVNASPKAQEGLDTWLAKHEPDAIISAGWGDFPQNFEMIHHRKAPTSIRYVNMNLSYADARSQGINKLSGVVGRLACEHLVAQLQRNEIGLPRYPQVMAIEGEWVDDYESWHAQREKWRAATIRKISKPD